MSFDKSLTVKLARHHVDKVTHERAVRTLASVRLQFVTVAYRLTSNCPVAYPALFALSRASQHDLSALRELNPTLGECVLFGDKAYADAETKTVFAKRGTHLVTPYKHERNELETKRDHSAGAAVSGFCQRVPLKVWLSLVLTRLQPGGDGVIRDCSSPFQRCALCIKLWLGLA